MTHYRFTFSGELCDGAKPDEVAHSLGKIFSCTPDAILPVLQSESIFVRRGLDQWTALVYRDTFKRAGALGRIDADTPEKVSVEENTAISSAQASLTPEKTLSTGPTSEPKSDEAICPKCGSRNLESGQCKDCGVYLHKVRAQTQAAEVKVSVEDTDEIKADVEWKVEKEKKSKSRPWLLYSTIAILVLLTGDSYLQNLYTPTQSGIDLGFLPLLLAHLALIRGCFLYADENGLEPLWGLAGCLSVAGVALLTIVVDREAGRSPRFHQIAVLVFGVGALVYWWTSSSNQAAIINELQVHAETLRQGRQEYPEGVIQDDEAVFERELGEMENFFREGLQHFQDTTMRPDQLTRAADRMFREFARYQAWRNYQRFLHMDAGAALPTSLTPEGIEQHHQRLAGVVRLSDSAGMPPRVREAYARWIYGAAFEQSPVSLMYFSRWMVDRRVSIMRTQRDEKGVPSFLNENGEIELEGLLEPPPQGARIELDKRIARYVFDDPLIKMRPLVIAHVLRVQTRRRFFMQEGAKEVKSYSIEMLMVSPDFPYHYLTGDARIFRPYEF